jgi:hypothetical protein
MSDSPENDHLTPPSPSAAPQPDVNLTRQAKLVTSTSGLSPVPGRYLVIYKRANSGWTFRECHPPGGIPRRRPFESVESFVTHAVLADRELRYSFSRHYRSHDQVHSFTLDLTIEYRVSAPVAVVAALDVDPLGQLVDEIDRVLVQAAKRLDWAHIEREQIDLERLFFCSAIDAGPAAQGSEATHLDLLRRFATGIGFDVRRISVARQLPQEEIVVSAQTNLATQQRQVALLRHGTAEYSLALAQDRAALRNQFDRGQTFASKVADSASGVVTREIEGARSLPELSATLQQVAGVVQHPWSGASGALAPPPGLPALAMSFPSGRQTATGTGGLIAAPRAPLAALLSDIADQLSTADPGDENRRRLLSAALHLVAEVILGGAAAASTLERYAALVQDLQEACFEGLTVDQIRLLQRLRTIDGLRSELAVA